MVKNIPENAAARASSDDDRAEKRHFSGQLPRSVAAIAAGLGSSAAGTSRANRREASGLTEKDLNANGRDATSVGLCVSERNDKNMRNVDFGDAIGKELQNLYDDLVAQPVPDRFLNLLNQLEKNMISSGLSRGAPGERE
ncbi:NepR family anti-sigma factor [Methylocystis sp. JAN1]|uniref:NepR family anti-sigma factor n=1 Tax=Methylocystis sp. JAN1 TaxID=3397211 RepID=UPI003FA281A9